MNNRPLSAGYLQDHKILDILIPMHSPCENPVVLDCTYNTGKMWKKCKYKPTITLDIDPKYNTIIVGSFKKMPLENRCIDIVVFDPPFLTSDGDSKYSSKVYKECYGITNNDVDRDGLNISKIFIPFLIEAKRIIKKRGIIIAKIGDMIHSGRYQWQHCDLINEAIKLGMNVDDMFIKIRNNVMNSSKWNNILHLRKNHSFFIVIKNHG